MLNNCIVRETQACHLAAHWLWSPERWVDDEGPDSAICGGFAASSHSLHAHRVCRRVNPYGENYYDGISLNPFEVMFVKVKGVLLQNDWSYARVAKKYDEWMTMQVPPSALALPGTPGPTCSAIVKYSS